MGRIAADKQISEADLAWFNLSNYDGLRDENLALWAQVILDRVELKRFITSEPAFVRRLFEQIKTSPLSHLGFERVTKNNSTVVSLNYAHFLGLDTALPCLSELSKKKHFAALVDDMIEADSKYVDRFAHLKIDLHATREKIVADFDHWLSAWQKSHPQPILKGDKIAKKISVWSKRLVIPYIDLQIFAELEGKKIPQEIIKSKLTTTHRAPSGGFDKEVPDSAKIDQLQRDKKKIFSDATVNRLIKFLQTSSGNT